MSQIKKTQEYNISNVNTSQRRKGVVTLTVDVT
jgi:hypothetical protein